MPLIKKIPISRTMVIFIGAMILANISSRMYNPLLPLYLQDMGTNVNTIGLFFTISSIIPLAFQILGGWVSDRIGRLRAVAYGSIAGVFGYLIVVLAPSWHWLLLATVFLSLAGSFVAPSFQAFIAEDTPKEDLGKVFGFTESLFMIVSVIGPTLGGFLADHYSFKIMLLVAFGLYSLATIIRIWMAFRHQNKSSGSADELHWDDLKKSLGGIIAMLAGGGVLTWIMISDGARDVTFSLISNLEPIYLQDQIGLSATQIGMLISIASIVTMILMTFGGWLSDRKGERVGIVIGFSGVVVAMILFISVHSFEWFVVVWIIFGLSDALISPAYNSLISKVVPQKLRGLAFGFFDTSLGVISLPSPYLGALMYTQWGALSPFYFPTVITFILLPIMWVKFKLPHEHTLSTEPLHTDEGSNY